MNTTAAQIATDDELIAALAASPDFITVTDSAHLAYLLDVDEDEQAPAVEDEAPADAMAADIATVRNAILGRIARRAPLGQRMSGVTVAMVWNWWEVDGIGAVAVERAIKGLISDGIVDETLYYGALAFDTILP